MGILFCSFLLGLGSNPTDKNSIGLYTLSCGYVRWLQICDLRSLSKIWHCLRVMNLCTIHKLCCKHVFDNEVSPSDAFYRLWRDKVHMQLLYKGALLTKDAKFLDPNSYSDVIVVLVVIRKRVWGFMYTFFLFIQLFMYICYVYIRNIFYKKKYMQ